MNIGDVLFESMVPGGRMLNCEPVDVESWCWCIELDDRDESTEVYGWRSRSAFAGGGVSARLSGDA